MHQQLETYSRRDNFNFENFANATENEILVGTLSYAVQPSAAKAVTLTVQDADAVGSLTKQASKYILTEQQRKKWNEIIDNVPKDNRVYIQA